MTAHERNLKTNRGGGRALPHTPTIRDSLRAVIGVVSFLAVSFPLLAVEPAEILVDPALEARARDVSQRLRCVVCQNQSIDDSNAELAHDMRVLVRERIVAGDADEDVVRFMVDRYGDFVTLMPPFKPATWALWFGPVVFVLLALSVARGLFRRRGMAPATAPLSEEEKRRLRVLMGEGDGRA